MSVTGPATTLSAILSQIQTPAPSRPADAPRTAQAQTATTSRLAAEPVARTPVSGVTQSGAANFNPNAPRGTYVNIVV